MPALCLLIGLDPESGDNLRVELPRLGIETVVAESGAAALEMMNQWRFDAALINAKSAGKASERLVGGLRSRARIPLIVLSSSRNERHHLAHLQYGATDVVVKPASARLIAAKLRGLIEFVAKENDDMPVGELALGPLVLQAREGVVTVAGRPLELTRHQFELLLLLSRHAGEFVSRATIARALPGYLKEVSRSADVHIYRIRKKLRELGVDSVRLDSSYGRGYRLSLDTASQESESAPAQLIS